MTDTDYSYICMDCFERFNTAPPFHFEPKKCPYSSCQSHDIMTTEIYDRNQEINAAEDCKEDIRLFKR